MDSTPTIIHEQSQVPTRGFLDSAGWNGVGLRLFGAALLGASLLAVGCDNTQTPTESAVTTEDVAKETGEAADTVARLAEQERNEFLQASRLEMEEIKADLEALKREAAAAQGEAKQKLDRQVAELEEKWNAADAKVAALRAETSEAWTEMKQEVLAALTDLKASYQEVRREMMRS
jgi:chromosome segregation ATPase